MSLPLTGVRVLAVEQHGAAPYGTLHLADLGAEVVKIEDPISGGDVSREISATTATDGLFFASLNRGKESVTLDLRSSRGREVLHNLVGRSDAVVTNLRGDAVTKLGLRYDALAPFNPAVVCCSLTGYGLTGPRANELGYDPIVQARAGWMSQTGAPGTPPTKSGLSIVDFMSGQLLALAVVSGVLEARRTGVGRDFDLSLFDTAVTALSYLSSWQLTAGHEPERRERSAHPSLVPAQLFRARDGWIMITAFKDQHFARLAGCLGRDHLLADQRFADGTSRLEHREELQKEIDTALETDDVDAWVTRLSAARIAAAPVSSIEEALRDPQVNARGLLTECQLEDRTVRCTGTPFTALASRDGHTKDSAPGLGADTERALSRILGVDGQVLAEWAIDGAFGPTPPCTEQEVRHRAK